MEMQSATSAIESQGNNPENLKQSSFQDHGGSLMKEKLKNAVLTVMEAEPLLGFHGFESGERELMTSDEGLMQFQMCCDWISRQPCLAKIKDHATSYAYKHTVEREVQHYIANGMWICAAIHLGLKYRRYRNYYDIICNLPKPSDCVQLEKTEATKIIKLYQKLWGARVVIV